MTEDGAAEAPAREGPRITKQGLFAFNVAILIVILDQLSKYWILHVVRLADRPPITVLPVFRLTMVWNQGVSFGLLRADSPIGRWVLVLFALGVVGALAAWARGVTRPLTAAALGLVMGGAIGNNLIDRVRFGAVADFLDFSGLGFVWVFNLADSAISVGVGLLLLDSLLRPKSDATG